MSTPGNVTMLLRRHKGGERGAFDQAVELLYGDLRRIASKQLRAERSDHTLTPTALLHEAYLRLVQSEQSIPEDRLQFFGLFARVIRNILCDYARSRGRQKRGSDSVRVEFDESLGFTNDSGYNLLDIDTVLWDLEKIDPEGAKIAELRFFAGLSLQETAEFLNTSVATVKRKWSVTRRWLYGMIDLRADIDDNETS